MARAMGGASTSLRRPFPLQRLVEAPPVGDDGHDIVWRFPGDQPCLAGSGSRGCHQPAAGGPDLMTSAIFPGSCGSPRDYAVSINRNLLTVEARWSKSGRGTAMRCSRWRRSYPTSVPLNAWRPTAIAKYEDGVLKLPLPKRKEAAGLPTPASTLPLCQYDLLHLPQRDR